jgi:hypothetical protein
MTRSPTPFRHACPCGCPQKLTLAVFCCPIAWRSLPATYRAALTDSWAARTRAIKLGLTELRQARAVHQAVMDSATRWLQQNNPD